jgi:hypothetical protein
MTSVAKAQMLTGPYQGLFDVLPEKLKERRSSLNLTPASARKRPSPGSEGGQPSERQPLPDLGAPLSSREHSATPSRARTLPSDYLAKLAKRNSLPDSVLSTFQEQMQNPQLMGFSSPSASSPMSPNYQFTPQLGNAQIPDLKNVMFPSDNPFAYPSQPLSALESADGQYSYSEASMTPNESNLFGTPSSGTHQIPQHFGGYDFAFQQALSDNPNLSQQFAAQGNRDFNAPFTDMLMQNAIGHDISHLGGIPRTTEPVTMSDLGTTANADAFWKRVGGGQGGVGQPLAQGVQQTNMDYFGSEGWNPAWGEQQYAHRFHPEG